MANSFCSECGRMLTPNKKFCGGCGTPVNVSAGAPALAQPQPVYEQQPAQPQSAYEQQPAYQQPAYEQQSAYQQPVYEQQPVYQQPAYEQQPAQPQPVQQPGYQQPYAPPQGVTAAMFPKQTVLANAPGTLNRPERPWEVTVFGDSIVARWKWMDATFFAAHEISDETKQFTFTVTLTDNGTWKELDRTENKKSGVKMSGGKLSFGSSSSTFKGKTNKKSFQFGVGKNNQTGEAGVIGFKFNTTDVKQPVRDYLTSCGWKKAGLF